MSSGKMHEGEFDLKVNLVSRLIADQFPQWRNLPLRQATSAGTDNALYRLGNKMVVRLPRIDWAVRAVKSEQHWLPLLASSLPISIPVPVALGKPGYGYPWNWSVYEWLGGKNPVVGHIDDPDSFAIELARFITTLQKNRYFRRSAFHP